MPTARLEAEFLLARLLDTDRGGLLVRRNEPLPEATAERYATWIVCSRLARVWSW